MTFDIKEWNIHACACRCLVELQRRRSRKLAHEDIHQALAADYPSWAKQPGATDTLGFCRIVREFSIGKYVETFIDAERVLAESKADGFIGVVGITERLPLDGAPGLSKTQHALLITPKEDQFEVWCPKKDGTASQFSVPWPTWYQWMIKGFVISEEPNPES